MAAHVLVLPFPTQGHINPMLQFSRRLASKGVRTTLLTTHFILNSVPTQPPVDVLPISDGYDEGGFDAAPSLEAYLESLQVFGAKSLSDLIIDSRLSSHHPFTCLVFDTYVPWAGKVAHSAGLSAVAFSTQSAAVSAVYDYVNKGLMQVPGDDGFVSDPALGLPPLARSEFPSMTLGEGQYPTLTRLSLTQFEGFGAADWVLFNSVEELEEEVFGALKLHWRVKPIGPTVPPVAVDKREGRGEAYGMNLLKPDEDACMRWLSERTDGSVVYVSFGSFAKLGEEQMQEIAQGLRRSGHPFLWVVRPSELSKLPSGFVEEMATEGKGLVVGWCPQTVVLAHRATGCFVTHCGWNSTLEALSLGVPMVAMPQWTDQPTNAKYVEEVWGVGVRARVDGESGVVRGKEVESCVRAVVEGKIIGGNARRWRGLVREALRDGGSSDEHLNEFADFVVNTNNNMAI